MRFQRKRFSVDGRALNFISFTNLTLEKNGKKFAQNFLNILRIFGGVIDAEKIIKKLTLLFGQFLFFAKRTVCILMFKQKNKQTRLSQRSHCERKTLKKTTWDRMLIFKEERIVFHSSLTT